MAKLTLPESAYKGIPNAKKCEKMTSPEYDNLAEEATKRIRNIAWNKHEYMQKQKDISAIRKKRKHNSSSFYIISAHNFISLNHFYDSYLCIFSSHP